MSQQMKMTAAALAIAAALSFGCNRAEEQQPPAAQTQTQTPVQSMNVPESVTGCLRAGDAAGTFVLTTTRAEEGTTPTTYQLTATTGVNLQDHVGHRVAVDGMVTQQQTSTTTSARAPATDEARGTSGATPQVQTSATLQLRQMEVRNIARASGDCEQ